MIVTDGFTGNVALKVIEGTAKTVSGAIRDAVRVGPVSTLGRPADPRQRRAACASELDPEDDVGGAILLGLRKRWWSRTASFGPEGIANAVRLAQRAVDERMVERTDGGARGRAARLSVRSPLLASRVPG